MWTEDQDETLKTMLAGGSTVAEAAKKVGVTRNAAMGRASRKGFQMNAPNSGGWTEERRQVAREERKARVQTRAKAERKHPILPTSSDYRKASKVLFTPKSPPKPQPVQRPSKAAPSLRLTLLEIRDNDCHFIEGDDHRYCGHPTEYLQACCPAHCRVVWQPLKPRAVV